MAGLPLASPSAERRVYSPWRETWRRYSRHKLAVVSAFLLLVLILAVVVGPFVWRVKIDEIDIVAGMQGAALAPPLWTHDLGEGIPPPLIYWGGASPPGGGAPAGGLGVFLGVVWAAARAVARGG